MARKKKKYINLLFPILRLWFASWRFKGNVPTQSPNIMLMWHEELFPILKRASHQNWSVIISPSKDGDYLCKLLAPWGFGILRGSASTHTKAVKVLRETIKIARDNKITLGIDGPRGPRREIKIGMLLAAQKTGVPIYLVRIRAKGFRLEKAWDKSLIPYPFSRITLIQSEPIYIDKDLDRDALEERGRELSQQLNELAPDIK